MRNATDKSLLGMCGEMIIAWFKRPLCTSRARRKSILACEVVTSYQDVTCDKKQSASWHLVTTGGTVTFHREQRVKRLSCVPSQCRPVILSGAVYCLPFFLHIPAQSTLKWMSWLQSMGVARAARTLNARKTVSNFQFSVEYHLLSCAFICVCPFIALSILPILGTFHKNQ